MVSEVSSRKKIKSVAQRDEGSFPARGVIKREHLEPEYAHKRENT